MTTTEANSESSVQEPNKKIIKLSKSLRNTFCICGHNGAALVEPVLLDRGWTRQSDRASDDYRLRWTELLCQINYNRFREGEQLVNHIPNGGLITNKLGLLTSLRAHDRSAKEASGRGRGTLEMAEFVPETYIIDDSKERDRFFSIYKEGEIWINKPTGLNQGKGINLIRDINELKKELDDRDNVSRSTLSGVKARIVQRYISNPLLINERKFDIRSYMYIASTTPYLVLYCPGYIRLSMNRYSNEDTDLITHLTNQFIQKKSPNYQEVKEDTVWSMAKFNEYMNESSSGLPNFKEDWAKTVLEKQMQQIMMYVFQSVKAKLASRVGFFELFGFDFMVDTNLKVWLIEVNVNPALHVNCALLKDILPPMIEEVVLLAIECFEKTTLSGGKDQQQQKRPLLPLESQKLFTLMHWESTSACRNRVAAFSSLRSWIPPRYRSNSHSPSSGAAGRDSQQQTRAPSLTTATSSKVVTSTSSVATAGPVASSTPRDVRFEQSLRSYPRRPPQTSQRASTDGSETVASTVASLQQAYHVRSKTFNPVTATGDRNRRHTTDQTVASNRGTSLLDRGNTSVTEMSRPKQQHRSPAAPDPQQPDNTTAGRGVSLRSLSIDSVNALRTTTDGPGCNTMTTATGASAAGTSEARSQAVTAMNTAPTVTVKRVANQSVKASPAQREPAPISLVQVVTGSGGRKKYSSAQESLIQLQQQQKPASAISAEAVQQFVANSPYKTSGSTLPSTNSSITSKPKVVVTKRVAKIYDRSS